MRERTEHLSARFAEHCLYTRAAGPCPLPGAGLSLWGQGDFLSGFPVLNWTHAHGTQRVDSPKGTFTPDAPHLSRPPEVAT